MAFSEFSTVDDVFRRYGEVCFRAQALEQSIENVAWQLMKSHGEASRANRDKLEGLSLGAIYKQIENEFEAVYAVWANSIRVFIRTRNYLAHRFFIEAKDIHASEAMCKKCLSYLEYVDMVCATASYHLALVIDELDLVHGGRFSMSIEDNLARSKGITPDTQITFKGL